MSQSLTDILVDNVKEKADNSPKHPIEEPKIITIHQLLSNKKLNIPEYQRPYKWTLKHVNQLVDDILLHQGKSAYRLGTLVVHQEQRGDVLCWDIVDGQQRAITLSLIAHALITYRKDLFEKIPAYNTLQEWPYLLQNCTSSAISQANIQANYQEIRRRARDFNQATLQFFFEKCQLVQVVLNDITEAFQFFDSQNSRGRDLEPHDLLKAFHLRAMSGRVSAEEELQVVADWEAMKSDSLANLFANYLYRIRKWSKGYSARYFNKEEVHVFKGINLHEKELFAYARLYQIGNFFVDDYNGHSHRQFDQQLMAYPFQLDQPIINGKRFFEMVSFGKKQHKHIYKKDAKENFLHLHLEQDARAIKILNSLDHYAGAHRTGDQYVRNLFDCALFYYINRFGLTNIGKAIEKLFIWAYTLRLTKRAVQLAAMDNYTREDIKLFVKIREAVHPVEIVNLALPMVKDSVSTRTEELEELFKEMNYL